MECANDRYVRMSGPASLYARAIRLEGGQGSRYKKLRVCVVTAYHGSVGWLYTITTAIAQLSEVSDSQPTYSFVSHNLIKQVI